MKKTVASIVLTVAMLIGMLSVMTVAPMSVDAEETAEPTIAVGNGDYDGNGIVNLVDYVNLMRYLGGHATLTNEKKAIFDVVADGITDITDAVRLFGYINDRYDTVGGAASVSTQEYATIAVETVEIASPVRIGDTVTFDLTACRAMADLHGLELRLAYDADKLCFVGTDSGLPLSCNVAPVFPEQKGGELWIVSTMSESRAVAQGDVLTTLTFEACDEITEDTAIRVLLCRAASAQGAKELYTVAATGIDGGIVYSRTTTATTTTTAPQSYVTYTVETVEHEGTLAAGETVTVQLSVSDVEDINGIQLYLCYDDQKLEWVEGGFVGQAASFSYKAINASPLHPMTDGGEVWLTAMDMKAYAMTEGTAFATATFRALTDITADTAITVCYAHASSLDSTMNGYVPRVEWIDGGIAIKQKTFTGPFGDYFYQNSVQVNTYCLIEHNGDFYFVGDGRKLAKNTTIYLADRFVNGFTYADGTPLVAGNYTFDESGKMVIKNGPVGDYFYRNNEQVKAYRLAEYNGDYYFINDGHKVAKNTMIYLADRFVNGFTYADGTPLVAGNYTFDESGKMVIKNGPVGDYFYRNNAQVKAYRLTEYNGDYYFINDGHKLVKNRTAYLAASYLNEVLMPDGTPFAQGYYTFDENGKLIFNDGPVGDYFYRNNVQLKAYQMVEYDGHLYFISDGHKLAKSTTIYLTSPYVNGFTYADGTALAEGYYTFDAEGKMVIKNGPVGDYFYRNNVQVKAYRLVEYNGDYYFINDGHKLVKNKKTYLAASYLNDVLMPDGTPFPEGYYTFDADGKMVFNDGPVGDCFYRNNVQLKAYQMVEYNGDYYFISDGHKLAKSTTIYLASRFVSGCTYADGTAFGEGYYTFDAEGKMVIKNGPIGEYFYRNNIQLKAYQMVEYNGDYYFINDGHKLAKNTTIYLASRFVSGCTYADGTALAEGYYTFDAEGKMVIKNGPVGEYFYRNNVQVKTYQLIEFEGDYYFINDGYKLVKNKTVYLTAAYVSHVQMPDGTPFFAGYYTFDEDGKLVM